MIFRREEEIRRRFYRCRTWVSSVRQPKWRRSSSSAIRLCPHGSEHAAFPHSAPLEGNPSHEQAVRTWVIFGSGSGKWTASASKSAQVSRRWLRRESARNRCGGPHCETTSARGGCSVARSMRRDRVARCITSGAARAREHAFETVLPRAGVAVCSTYEIPASCACKQIARRGSSRSSRLLQKYFRADLRDDRHRGAGVIKISDARK